MKPTVYVPALALAALAACNSLYSTGDGNPGPAHTTFTALGDSTTIANKLTEFRTALGGALNAPNSPPAASGRREINWDGVSPALTNVDTFPLNFFNVNSARGAVYLTPGSGVRIDSTAFASINATLPDQFKPFSGKKLFMPVGSRKVEVDFELVATTTPGVVNGFGVVFSDVDRTGSTRILLLDASDAVIADISVPGRAGSKEFSFVGVVFEASLVAKAQIISGDAALDATTQDQSAGGTKDLVVMDDFIYGEPQPLP
jgi:hypothetical protein